ncbi:hypothetical protein CPLU01_00393 [Colletotrichum plurivorum]|uniref:Uncharacterized protein n=1 Tax=Colletotrichum plurivorum TaxID=2175906 RepID=A0A8H6U655_9PEZI|nr:hypothetical protein CPLU01_00393 [Colletotrichum plurivorum]
MDECEGELCFLRAPRNCTGLVLFSISLAYRVEVRAGEASSGALRGMGRLPRKIRKLTAAKRGLFALDQHLEQRLELGDCQTETPAGSVDDGMDGGLGWSLAPFTFNVSSIGISIGISISIRGSMSSSSHRPPMRFRLKLRVTDAPPGPKLTRLGPGRSMPPVQ